MMREQRELEEYFDGFLRERRGTLNIGAPAFFCTYVLPALVKKFGEEHLDAKVNIIEAGVDDLANCLQSETIDLCIAVEEWPANAYKKRRDRRRRDSPRRAALFPPQTAAWRTSASARRTSTG